MEIKKIHRRCKCGCREITNLGCRYIRYHQFKNPHSKEHKKKISLSLIRNSNPLGCKRSKETRLKMSLWQIEKKYNPDYKYCNIWRDKEYKNDLRKNYCENINCKNDYKRLGLHHIYLDKKRCAPDEIMTLCNPCHVTLHHLLQRSSKRKINPKDYIIINRVDHLSYIHKRSRETIRIEKRNVMQNKIFQWKKIKKITRKKLPEKIKVYNIECSPNNNYIANQVLVHNCFAAMQKLINPSFSRKLHAVKYKAIISTIEGRPPSTRLRQFHKHFFSKRFVLHWGGLADPFCNFEKANNIGYKIVHALAEENYPTLFSFKGSAIFRPNFEKLLTKYAHQKNFAFQASIISPSDKMSRKIEVGVPVTSKRIKALKYLSDMGYYTVLRLRPFIIGISDDGLDDLLYKAKEAGINAVSTEFVAIDLRNSKSLSKRYEWMGKLIGTENFLEYFKALSPSERGGYMRLNRLVKERFVKQIYTFCVKNNILFACSDPDFKELNMSGSCCGMPDNYKENKEMENWSRSQLSFHIKEARRKYHLDGSITKFKFEKVFKTTGASFLKNTALTSDHISVAGKTASDRRILTFLEIARTTWNNLRSPGNPQNYFHGKMLPIRVDENENYVYVYHPSEYEDRWSREGIDLTK